MKAAPYTYLPGRIIAETAFFLNDMWVFKNAEKCLLLSRSGHIMLVSADICQMIYEGNISEDFLFKLLQRKFAVPCGEDLKEDVPPVTPMFFMIDLTNRCNMSCRYCLRDINSRSEEESISENRILDICSFLVNYCEKIGDNRITIQPWGGEPLLEADKIFLMQDELRKHGINPQITIETNGLLLDEKMIKELNRRGISISISIDGYKNIHDLQRVSVFGKGTHVYVENKIRQVQNLNGADISSITTITKNSIDHISEIMEYFVKDIGLKHLKMNFVHRSKFADNDKLCLSPEEIADASTAILDKIVGFHRNNMEVYEYNTWLKSMNLLAARKMDVCYSNGCCGGRMMISIDKKGDIYPCDVTDFPEEKLGIIYETDDLISQIKKTIPGKSYFKRKGIAECDTCPWWHYCRGGCTVHMKCAVLDEGVDQIECSVNKSLYPQLVSLILDEPEMMNRLVGYQILRRMS